MIFSATHPVRVELSDHGLLRALMHGDEAAMREIHRRYAGRFLSLAIRKHLALPERAVENAFIGMFQAVHGYERAPAQAPAWIMGMALWQFHTGEAGGCAASPRGSVDQIS